MQRALVEAAARGVEVYVLVPAKGDVALAAWAARASYAGLLADGVRIFEYQPRMLHAKVLQADESWVAVGTANLDYRSLLLNHELTVLTRDTELCAALRRQFEENLDAAREVTLPHWRHRAWNRRPAEWIGWAARRWL
jgi:cardiolipin synthase